MDDAIKSTLTSEELLIGSEAEGCFDALENCADDNFVGDGDDFENLSNQAPKISEWKMLKVM